ncbi:MAG: Hsp70 family protein, partial [Actinobacteria bacterium]|nr:Hsp70 family protein [Actinomycetota bacterium]NIS34071.1 Hsp70 family protein [Actinomycetota bacterium]NIT94075.1 Hsp70 family protein [Actinomycetota bacterium]NIU17703.1 Hsp70 family protein [Actinomycetota bacterium]NIU68868.1 Hsp70 family protein [Actinomycetota bacterium]
ATAEEASTGPGTAAFAETDPALAVRFLEAAETAKIALSEETEHRISLPFYDGKRSLETTVTRDDLERLAAPII